VEGRERERRHNGDGPPAERERSHKGEGIGPPAEREGGEEGGQRGREFRVGATLYTGEGWAGVLCGPEVV
jgi:hypothetical protein